MKTRSILTILLLIVAGLQTAWAQKVVLHKTNGQTIECNVSELDSIVFVPGGLFLSCPDDHHPHAIDLGLPSGTKWCCCNVGADKPEEYGDYFAWGEPFGKSYYSSDNYVHYDSNTGGYTNIGSDIARTDYDAATIIMRPPWRMPTIAQQQELIDNCSHEWTQQNGVSGILVTGPNGGRIFLPAAGFSWDG